MATSEIEARGTEREAKCFLAGQSGSGHLVKLSLLLSVHLLRQLVVVSSTSEFTTLNTRLLLIDM